MKTKSRSKLLRFRPVVLLLALLITVGSAQGHHAGLPVGVSPVEATWLWGQYIIPDTITRDGSPYVYAYPHRDPARIIDRWTEVAARQIKPGTTAPAVLFMHGCSGLIRGGMGYRILFMSAGYAVFEPDAFARPGYSCAKSSITTRQAEVAYALAQIRKLPWVDPDRIILMGNSQGGRTVALWDQPGFAAHIIVAASCLSSGGANQYAPRAPDNVPVLVVVGSGDANAKPNCQIDRSVGGSRLIVIADAGHDIMGHPELKRAVKTFLRTCCQ